MNQEIEQLAKTLKKFRFEQEDVIQGEGGVMYHLGAQTCKNIAHSLYEMGYSKQAQVNVICGCGDYLKKRDDGYYWCLGCNNGVLLEGKLSPTPEFTEEEILKHLYKYASVNDDGTPKVFLVKDIKETAKAIKKLMEGRNNG